MPDFSVSDSFPFLSLAADPDLQNNWIINLFGLKISILSLILSFFLFTFFLAFTIFIVKRKGWINWGEKKLEKGEAKDALKISLRKFPRKEKVS